MLHFAVVTAGLLGAGTSGATTWPTVALPPYVKSFAVGEQIIANGLPMRVQGFVAQGVDVPKVAEWFKASLGQPLVESSFRNQLILGRAEGGFYVSVQLEALGADPQQGSKGLVAISDMASLNRDRERDQAAHHQWLARWPAGTQTLSRMTSQDNGATTLHVALRNGHSTSLNRDALVDLMQQDGLALEREVAPDRRSAAAAAGMPADGTAYFFKGQGKSAMATMARDGDGQTTIVLNITKAIADYRPAP
ncbi:MAG: hypothetical protein EOO32_02380 [Comamonadaceae bacterium]|nr:MAG: hypothetical protein EOO32_02380 [Comamonadaceae bacterium]